MIKFIVISSFSNDVKVLEANTLLPDEFVGAHYGHKSIDEYSDMHLIFNHCIEDGLVANKTVKSLFGLDFNGDCLIANYDPYTGVYYSLEDEEIDYILRRVKENN